MNATMSITLYLGLGLTLALLRLRQDQTPAEACLAGLIWPIELLLTATEAAVLLTVPHLVGTDHKTG